MSNPMGETSLCYMKSINFIGKEPYYKLIFIFLEDNTDNTSIKRGIQSSAIGNLTHFPAVGIVGHR
jgi:hypothetical protein